MTFVLLMALLIACSEEQEPSSRSPSTPATSASAVSLRDRCGPLMPDQAAPSAAQIETQGMRLTAGIFEAPDARVGLVLLHQIGGTGLCGWAPFAFQAAQQGLTAMAIDMCGYGESNCDDRYLQRPEPQVQAATTYLREKYGVRRIVVVGASMGGSQAVRAVAQGADVDAWVDVSGPSAWDSQALLPLASKLRVPGLVVQARSDGASEYRAALRLAHDARADFLDGGAGHGWDLVTTVNGRLTRTGQHIIDFAKRADES